MAWINPLDRVPQIPKGYANHFIYAQLLYLLLLLVMNLYWAFVIVLLVSVGKKVVDYRREMEPLSMCAAKAAVSIAGGAVPFLCLHFAFEI